MATVTGEPGSLDDSPGESLDVRLRQLALAIGVDIRGVDLSRPLPREVFEALQRALADQGGRS